MPRFSLGHRVGGEPLATGVLRRRGRVGSTRSFMGHTGDPGGWRWEVRREVEAEARHEESVLPR